MADLIRQMIMSRLQEQRKVEQTKASLLMKPETLDKLTASLLAPWHPSPDRLGKPGKFVSKTAQFEAAIDEDHPLKGFASDFKQTLQRELASSRSRGYSAEQIAQGVLEHTLGKPKEPGRASRIEETFKHFRVESTALPLLGEDIAKPPMYDEWLASRRPEEEALEAREDDDYWQRYAEMVGIGAGAGLALGAAIGGIPTAGVGAVPAGLAGGVVGGLTEAIAFPVREWVEKGEWGQARKHSNSAIDRAKVLYWTLPFEMLGGGIAELKMLKMLRAGAILKGAKGKLTAKPTAEGFLDADAAGKKFALEVNKAAGPIGTRIGQEGLTPMLVGAMREVQTVGGKETAGTFIEAITKGQGLPIAARNMLRKMSLEGFNEMLDLMPSMGLVKAASKALNKDFARTLGRKHLLKDLVTFQDGIIAAANKTNATMAAKGKVAAVKTAKTVEKTVKEVVPPKVKPKPKTKAKPKTKPEPPLEEGKIPTGERFAGLPSKVANDAETVYDDLFSHETVEVMQDAVNTFSDEFAIAPKVVARSMYRQLMVDTMDRSGVVYKGKFADIRKTYSEAVKQGKIKEIDSDDVNMFESMYDAMMEVGGDTARRTNGTLKGLAIFGLTAPAFMAVATEGEVEASVGSLVAPIGKAIAKVGRRAVREGIIEEAHRIGLTTPEVIKGQMLLAAEHFQKQFAAPSVGIGQKAVAGILKDVKGWIKSPKKIFFHGFMSPDAIFQTVLNIGPEFGKRGLKHIMNSPSVHRVSAQSAEYNNVRKVNRILDNIFAESGVGSVPRKVEKLFDPLLPDMKKWLTREVRLSKMADLDDSFKLLKKKKYSTPEAKRQDIAVNRAKYARHRDVAESLEGATEQFHKRYDLVAEQAAREFPSVRVALTMDGGAEKYSFMKYVKLTDEETVLVGRLRDQLAQYTPRLQEIGADVIKGPYLHYNLHPKFGYREMAKIADDSSPRAAAYTKMHVRHLNSRPMLPDIHTSMRHYVMDAERRIQHKTYWDVWQPVRDRVQNNVSLKKAFDYLAEGSAPYESSFLNKFSNVYIQLEAFKRLWLNPSAGLKHLCKATADVSAVGFEESITGLPLGMKLTARRMRDLMPDAGNKLSKIGIKGSRQDDMLAAYFNSLVPARNIRTRVMDMGLNMELPEELYQGAKGVWFKNQAVGSSFIGFAEVFDRAMSVSCGLGMAAKKGLTVEQAMYGTMDLILRNNFLSREFNPSWLRNPKFRALFMFQSTPYKILERRLVNAVRTGRALTKGAKSIRKLAATQEGRTKLLEDLRHLRSDMKTSEQKWKSNIFVNALRDEVDFYGTPVTAQFAKDMLIVGGATIGGAAVGIDLSHHFAHMPFLRGAMHDPSRKVLMLSPGVQAVMEGMRMQSEREAADNEFPITKAFHQWMGKSGLAPDILGKMDRISGRDIPEFYIGTNKKIPPALKYLFALPPWTGH